MNNYATAKPKKGSNTDLFGKKRQEKALREFKQVINDLIFLLRSASEMETVYLYWVNRSRNQFVMETKSTVLENVMFKDRIEFENHFLNRYKNLEEPKTLRIEDDIPSSEINHYYDEVPIKYITLLPFINNGETVAITVLESRERIITENKKEIIYSFINALRNVLNTYLEISDLHEQQNEWIDYENCLIELQNNSGREELLKQLLNTIQQFLHDGGVSFITKGMGSWYNVMNADEAKYAPPVGMSMEERSLAYDAVDKGEPEFAIHFNNNPKRLSPREFNTDGATLAIPLMLKDRRQGVILVYDTNPLVFKEATKHKLINLVRIVSLQILANHPKMNLDEPIFTNEYNAFVPDLWKQTVNSELARLQHNPPQLLSWFGLVTLGNLSEIRTRLRLEQLDQLQREVISIFRPTEFGYPGILGYHSDYVYAFFIQNKDEQAVKKWTQALKKKLEAPLQLTNGIRIKTGIKVGFLQLSQEYSDFYQLLSNAKKALSQAINHQRKETF